MKSRLLSQSVFAAALLVAGAASQAQAEETVERLVVTPNAIQMQMLLAQREIRQELLNLDWRAIALAQLREVLSQPIVVAAASGERYAAR